MFSFAQQDKNKRRLTQLFDLKDTLPPKNLSPPASVWSLTCTVNTGSGGRTGVFQSTSKGVPIKLKNF